MLKQVVAIILLSLCLATQCADAGSRMQKEIGNLVGQAGIDPQHVGVWLAKAGHDRPVFEHRSQVLMQPASTVKVVTTLAGLELLQPNFTWKTAVYVEEGPDAQGNVRGVTVRGGGDPHLVTERLWLLSEQLRQSGIRRIEGPVRIDRSLFGETAERRSSFDGRSQRPYNVGADAALLNFQSLSVLITPDEKAGIARLCALPKLKGMRLQETIALKPGKCSEWKQQIAADATDQNAIVFRGSFPAGCGAKQWHLAYSDNNRYWGGAFGHLFEQSGGQWNGQVIDGAADSGAKPYLVFESEPLFLIVYYINKYSNNPMARHLFLTLGLTDSQGATAPLTLERSRRVLREWLRLKGIDPQTVQIDNGSGLSRQTRITAQSLGRILSAGFRSRVMPELMGSFPLAGVDGTLKRKELRRGAAHLKTGTIDAVKSVAGFVDDASGSRYSLVIMVNDRQTDKAQKLIDAIVRTVAQSSELQ